MLDKYDKLEEELKAEAERTKEEQMEAIASLKPKHTEELRKKDSLMRQLCEKNKIDHKANCLTNYLKTSIYLRNLSVFHTDVAAGYGRGSHNERICKTRNEKAKVLQRIPNWRQQIN